MRWATRSRAAAGSMGASSGVDGEHGAQPTVGRSSPSRAAVAVHHRGTVTVRRSGATSIDPGTGVGSVSDGDGAVARRPAIAPGEGDRGHRGPTHPRR